MVSIIVAVVGCHGKVSRSTALESTHDEGDRPVSDARTPDSAVAPVRPAIAPSHAGSLSPLSEGGEDLAFAERHAGVLSVAFVPPDGKFAISSGIDDTTFLWDTRTGRAIHRYAGKAFRFNCVRMTADGVHALTDGDLGANYWEVQTGKVLRRFSGPRFGFSTVALSPDERIVATSGSDGLTFWGFDSERAVRRIDGASALSIGYSLDSTRAFWVGVDDRLCQAEVHGHGSPTCFDIDAGRLDVADVEVDESLTGERDGDLTLWANGTGRRLRSWSANERAIDAVSFLPSRALAASAGEDRTIRVWRTDAGKLVSERQTVGFATAVALSGDGGRVIYGTDAGDVHVWTIGGAER